MSDVDLHPVLTRRLVLSGALATAATTLGACAARQPAASDSFNPPLYPNETPELRKLIEAAARENNLPVTLVQRVVIRESRHNARARNGPYRGLMQILPQTARTMGYSGPPEGLLDAETNLRYGVRYLRGAWLVSDGDEARAVGWYARGYYYEARNRGMLRETGLRR